MDFYEEPDFYEEELNLADTLKFNQPLFYKESKWYGSNNQCY